MKQLHSYIDSIKHEIISFAQELVRIPSVTGHEREVALAITSKMNDLGYEDIHLDALGNVLGTFGKANCPVLLLDSHMDTVPVTDEDQWAQPPFSGTILEGDIYGRGSADMKCGLAASLYAAHAAHKFGFLEDRKVLVTATVMEEDYEGVALQHLIEQQNYKISGAIMCEPTNMAIGVGHSGRALIEIKVQGKSAHASHPDLGVNAIYAAALIANRVEILNQSIDGTTTVTSFQSLENPLNSIPASATLFLDRRLTVRENEEFLHKELDELIRGVNATWRIFDVEGKTWTGENILLHTYLPAWDIPHDHSLVKIASDAVQAVTENSPQIVTFGFSTNGTATATYFGIPTLILGPGKTENAHMIDERCNVNQMIQACKAYAQLCAEFPA